MKRSVLLALAAVLMSASLVAPALAASVIITTSAPLDGDSDDSVQDALDQAVGYAVDGAMQMGLRPVQLTSAEVWNDRVVVQVLATNAQPDEDEEDGRLPGLRPGEHLALDRLL